MAAFSLSACLPDWLNVDQLPWLEKNQVLFADDFSDQTTGWENINDVYELKGYSDNAYIISLKRKFALLVCARAAFCGHGYLGKNPAH